MAAPTTAQEAIDRLAARMKVAEDTLALLVADAGLDLFNYAEWQQDPPLVLPPWMGEEHFIPMLPTTGDVS
jgi:hypothetical protein